MNFFSNTVPVTKGLAVLLPFTFGSLLAQEEAELPASSINIPTNPAETDFEALRTASPFVRILNPAEIYTLRGVAQLDNQPLATLYNRETKKSLLVSPDKASDEGIQLVEVVGGQDLEGVTAKVSFAGEEVELKYQLEGLYPRPRSGSGGPPRPGGGDGERRGPSKEDVDRYKSLSEENRNQLRQYIGHVMKTYPNMSREERGNMIRGAMTRLSDGRGLEMPQTTQPQGGGSSGNSGGGGGQRPPQGQR